MIILASTSAVRLRLLENAGVSVRVVAPDVDEESLKKALWAQGISFRDGVDALAEAKSIKISKRFPDDFVLGCDQILITHQGKILDKPRSLEEVGTHIRLLSGQQHRLMCAAVISHNGYPIWRAFEEPVLKMRTISEDFIQYYVSTVGHDVQSSVGAYHLEGLGAQLFSSISGDYFSILGLPLLSILAYLREHKVILQ